MKQKKMLALLLSLAMIVTTVLGNGTFVSASATKEQQALVITWIP